MNSDLTKNLTKYELFEGLPDEVIGELGKKITTRALKKNEILFHQGDPGDALYLIRSGWVKIVKEDLEEGEVVLNHIGPGGIIGEMAIFDEEPRSSGIVAISDVEMLVLKSDDFMNLLNEQPMMTLPIIRSELRRLQFTTTYIENTIEWSKRIAAGDYNFVEKQMQLVGATIVDSKELDKERANRFLGTFFRMVEEIRSREDKLKQQLQKLKVEIDQAKRKQAIHELAESEFFIELKEKSEQMRNLKSGDKV